MMYSMIQCKYLWGFACTVWNDFGTVPCTTPDVMGVSNSLRTSSYCALLHQFIPDTLRSKLEKDHRSLYYRVTHSICLDQPKQTFHLVQYKLIYVRKEKKSAYHSNCDPLRRTLNESCHRMLINSYWM